MTLVAQCINTYSCWVSGTQYEYCSYCKFKVSDKRWSNWSGSHTTTELQSLNCISHLNKRKRPCWLTRELPPKYAHTHFCSFSSGLRNSGTLWFISSLSFCVREQRTRAVTLARDQGLLLHHTHHLTDSVLQYMTHGRFVPPLLWSNLRILYMSIES